MKLADHVGLALADAAETDARICVLDGDLADSDGAWHFAQRHPDRFLMAGIAEQGMISTAAGMATAGLRPWVFSFAAFLCYRALDQTRICLSQSAQPVTLLGSHAGGLSGRNGKTHAAPGDLALMLSMPNIAVWAPGDAADARMVVRRQLDAALPGYVRTPRRQFGENDVLPGDAAPVRWLRPRQPVALLSCGLASHWALATAELLAQAGHCVGVLHCAQLKPFGPLLEALEGVERVFVIEDHSRFGGLASLVQMLMPRMPVDGFGWPVDFTGKSGADETLQAHYGLDPDSLFRAIRAQL